MEELMQYVWEYRLWPTASMVTIDGRRVEVLDVGLHNKDAGPDFFNAKVLIGGQEWIGNIEMHVRASDWHKHGHDNDRAYDNVVLHVVDNSDCVIKRKSGEEIPQLIMRCAPDFSQKYCEMVHNPFRQLPCATEIKGFGELRLHDWLTALAMERIYEKSERIVAYLQKFAGDWTAAIYIALARALGFSTNSQPFEMLAFSTPLKNMLHYTDSLKSIEAMLFGQAGLLVPGNEYAAELRNEYDFLAKKFRLQPSSNLLWKMAKMRPQNFPHRRIAALASLIADNFSVGRNLLTVKNEEEARKLFDITLSGYWARHCNFGPETLPSPKAFGYASTTVLLINVVVPVLHAYGQFTGQSTLTERAVDMLQSLKPESNNITMLFESAGVKPQDAFTSQALIQLKRQYCESRKCIYCRIGHHLLSKKVVRSA